MLLLLLKMIQSSLQMKLAEELRSYEGKADKHTYKQRFGNPDFLSISVLNSKFNVCNLNSVSVAEAALSCNRSFTSTGD